MDLQHVIINNLNKLENWQQKKLVVGYSGGLDSTVLLFLIASLKKNFPEIRVSAIHVNHGLMEQCHQWQLHCEKFCNSIEVPLLTVKIASLKNSGKGIENAAREARFETFEKNLTKNALLLLAHHANDQSETVIYRLLRGSGVVGLSGIKLIQTRNNITIVRPLLEVDKNELEHFSTSNNLNWIEDDSNLDESYDRNFIRKNVIPVLQSRWKDLHQKLTKNTLLLEQQSVLLDELASEDSKILLSKEGYLKLEQLKNLTQIRVLNFLAWWFRDIIGYSLNATRLNLIYNELYDFRSEAKFKQYCSDSILLQSRNRAYLVPRAFFDKSPEALSLNGKLPINWKKNLTINISEFISIKLHFKSDEDFQKLKELDLTVHSGITNKKIKFFHKQHSSELRKSFQQKNVPSWLKPNWPVLFKGKDLVTIPGFGHLENFGDSLSGMKITCSFVWGKSRHFEV